MQFHYLQICSSSMKTESHITHSLTNQLILGRKKWKLSGCCCLISHFRVPSVRAEWRSALHNALEGQASFGPDDVDEALAKASQRATDLEGAITSLLDTARYAPDWKTRESMLGWAEDVYRQAKGITKELRGHITLVEVSEGVSVCE